MSTQEQISQIVTNPPTCQCCPEHHLVVTSQSLAVSDSGLGSVINAGCGSCGGLFEVSLDGKVLGELDR